MNVHEIITQRIIKKLESGTVPWKRPWKHYAHGFAPMNFASKKPYRGINVWMLASSGHSSPYWASYKQWEKLKGQVRKGEKGTPIIYWQSNTYNKVNDSGESEEKRGLILKYYTVFNLNQVSGIEAPQVEEKIQEFNPIESCESLIKKGSDLGRVCKITHEESEAYYKPSQDLINMPKRESFEIPIRYYSTLFHELVHSTGHKSRLDRDGITKVTNFGSESYSKEELIAEMGASFLCAHAGIYPDLDQSAAYLKSWISALRGDSRLIISASSAAQRASEYLLGIEHEKIEENKNE